MEKNHNNKEYYRYGIRTLCALLAVVISGLLVAGATFDWGNVHYSRITFTYSNNGNNGDLNTYEGSAIMYVPKNATKDTPAPAVLSIHGISSNAQSQSNYAIELARRGYVVMSVDLPGSGYTDMVGQNPPVKQDMTTFLDEAVKVLESLNYVQQGNMTSFGFSGGVAKAYETAARHKDTFNLIIGGSGSTAKYVENEEYQGINKIGITSDSKMCGTPDTVTGSVEDGTYTADYYFRNYVTHVWMTISGESMYGICKYINEVNPAPIQIDPSNQTYLMAHFFSVLGYISVICFLITFTQFLLNTKTFAKLKRAEFPSFNTEEPKWQKIAFIVGTMVLNVLAMLILVVKLQVVPLDSGTRAIPLWFNVYVPYFIAIGVIDLLMFIFRFHFRFGKKQGGTLVAYDVLEEGGALESIKSIAKALLIGFVVAGSIFAVLTVIESKLGVRFNFFDWALNVGPTKLLVHSWFYTEWNQWAHSEKEQLAAVMERHGIEWEDKGTHDKHLSVLDFKKEQRAKEIAELDAVKAKKQGQVEQQEQRLKELAPAVRNMERLAAQFSDDPERILPEPGLLESAKSYREKKAKPLLAKIVKVLRSLYRAYVELKEKYERLQGDYGRVREGNANLSERLQEMKMENKALRATVADYERVKRAFGPEEVERAVEDAKRRDVEEREQRRKAKRKFDRGGR